MLLPAGTKLSVTVALVVLALMFQVGGGAATGPAGTGRMEQFIVSLATLIVLGITSYIGARERRRLADEQKKVVVDVTNQQNQMVRDAAAAQQRLLEVHAAKDEREMGAQTKTLDQIHDMTNSRLSDAIGALKTATAEIAALKETNGRLVEVISDMSLAVRLRSKAAGTRPKQRRA